jgi:hypothetical protein
MFLVVMKTENSSSWLKTLPLGLFLNPLIVIYTSQTVFSEMYLNLVSPSMLGSHKKFPRTGI